MRDYEYITDATDNRLAEMLEEEAKKQENIASIAITEQIVDQCRELAALLRTAAQRLRERRHIEFNHEAFE